MKNIFTKNLILALVFMFMSVNVANAQATSGTCGDNLTWNFDSGTGTLTIEGTGAMNNYVSYSSVPWYSFRSSITSLSLPEGLTSIDNYAFAYCYALTSVTIPNSVTTIGNDAFSYCIGLTSVIIPNSVTSIGNEVFVYCSVLTAINVDEANQYYSSIDGVLYNKTQTTLIQCPAGKTSAVIIPNSVTSIDNLAFAYCDGLTSVTIPNSVTVIGNDAFYYCIGLTSLIIGNSVETIGNGAFRGCSGLTSVTCNAINPPTIDSYTFNNIATNAVFYVPCQSLDAYQAAQYWSGLTYGDCISAGIENVSAKSIVFYPNPAITELRIENLELKSGEMIEIYDISGKKTLNFTLLNNNSIDVSALSSGVYFVKIGNSTGKFIKK
jgi:hypothetical protein